MEYKNFTTFSVEIDNGIAWVTIDYPPVNVQGQEMLADLSSLALRLERDREVKVVVFQSANPDIWVCHYDTNLLRDMSMDSVSRDEAKLLDLQAVLERISKLPQATIAKIEGFARGGGHEFALACDMRFAARGKYKFMQMEVAMGILPCGGGASRMARQVGLGRALEIILSARDFDADEAEAYGTINKALEPTRLGSTWKISRAVLLSSQRSPLMLVNRPFMNLLISPSMMHLRLRLTGYTKRRVKRRRSSVLPGQMSKGHSSTLKIRRIGRNWSSTSKTLKMKTKAGKVEKEQAGLVVCLLCLLSHHL